MSTMTVSVLVKLIDQLTGPLKTIQGRLSSIGDRMQTVGRRMTTFVSAPIAGIGGLILRTAANFESAMNRVQAVSGATSEEFSLLRRQARDLGATTMFSASEAADAMGFLAMAGFDARQIMEAMPGTLQLAASAQLDLARAADIVSNVLTGYGLEASELGRVNDVLVTSFTSANTNLEQLGEAMKYAGPVAKAAGVEFEEAAATLALMGNAGIQGSMAGTSLRGALTRILNPTKQVAEAMEAAELAFTDAQGRLLPLSDILDQLEPHADNAGLFMQLFGQRAGPAMAALAGQGADALEELTAKLRDSGGTAQRISDVQMQGLEGAFRELASAWEELQLALADSGGLDWATQGIKSLTEWVRELGETNPELLRWVTTLAIGAAVIGPIIFMIGLFASALAMVLTPVGLVILGLAALGALAAYIYSEWDGIAAWFGDLWDRVANAFEEGFWNGVVTALIEFNPLTHLVRAWDRLIEWATGVSFLDFVEDWISEASERLSELTWSDLLPYWDWIIIIPSPLAVLSKLLGFSWRELLPDWRWSDIIPSIREALSGILSFSWRDLLPSWNWRDIIPPMPSLFGRGGSDVEARAGGGPVTAGRPYIVGERGWELFVPGQNGTIIPHHDAKRGVGGTKGFAAMQAGGSGAGDHGAGSRHDVGGRIVVEAAPGTRIRNMQSDNPAVPLVSDRGTVVGRA